MSKEQVLRFLDRIAEERLASIHGAVTVDYCLGYQRCAKDLRDAVEAEYAKIEERNGAP